MKKQVVRIDLAIEPKQIVKIPYNSEFLDLTYYHNTPSLWVLSDVGQRLMERKFLMIESEAPETLNASRHVGTFYIQADIGAKVIHVFEEG